MPSVETAEQYVERINLRKLCEWISTELVLQLKGALSASSLDLIELFRGWDQDGSGKIDMSEFRLAVIKLKLIADDDTISEVFSELDHDKSSFLEYEELAAPLQVGRGRLMAAVTSAGVASGVAAAARKSASANGVEVGAAPSQPSDPPRAAPTNGKVKRLKRELYVARVRERMAAR